MADTASQPPKDLIGFLDFYLVRKAPFQIPEGGKEAIVKYGPIVLVILLLISIPAILVILGIGTFFVPFGGLPYATGFGAASLFLLIEIGLEIAALPGLFARKMSGWRLLFYGRLLAIVYGFLILAWLSAIVGGLISMYILFQVREKYS
jgi:hypothetical protein